MRTLTDNKISPTATRSSGLEMTDKELKETLTSWIQRDNPKFKLLPADRRCGARYAVGENSGTIFKEYTPYLPLKQLEQYLQGVYHAKEYLSHTINNK